jgi:hypothetical protein
VNILQVTCYAKHVCKFVTCHMFLQLAVWLDLHVSLTLDLIYSCHRWWVSCITISSTFLLLLLLFISMGVRLCLWTAATNRLLVHPQMIHEYKEPRWNNTDRGKPKNSEKTRPSATLSTTSPTRIDPSANPGLRGERPATNGLSHGTAYYCY